MESGFLASESLNGLHWKKKALAWLAEIALQALSTGMLMLSIALQDRLPWEKGVTLHDVATVTVFVLIGFGITGYFVTTVIASEYLRSKRFVAYPLVVALLYLIHSTMFFVGAGNSLFDKHDLWIQLPGCCAAAMISQGSNHLLLLWNRKTPQAA